MKFRGALVGCVLLGSMAKAFGQGPATPAPTHSAEELVPPTDVIDVEIDGLRNDAGTVSCALFQDAGAFPTHPEHAVGKTRVEIHQRVAHCRFQNVPPGTYAVAVHHDENNNHRMDTNLLGIPEEGYGFTRDVRPLFAPPKFEDAKFDFGGGVLHLTLHIRY